MRPGERGWNLIGLVLLCLVWWALVGDDQVFLPPFVDVARAFGTLTVSGQLPVDALASILRVLAGVTVASVLAFMVAVLAALSSTGGHLLSGILELLRPIPPIAWVPVAILTFGIGDAPAVAIVALGAFFPIWMGFVQGATEVRAQHLLAARSFGASPAILLLDVVIPSMLPYVLHGLRLGVGLGWFCVVAAEMMGANSGLGHGVQLFSLNIRMGYTYCYILSIGALGVLMNMGMRTLEHRLCRWHRASVKGET